MLIVLAVLGILLALGLVFLRPASARLLSNDLKALLQTARYEAVRFQTPVAVVWSTTNQRFEMRLTENSNTLGTVCTTGTVRQSKHLTDYPGATATGGVVSSGIVWLPSGLVRQCDGTALTSGLTVTVADGRNSFQVQLSAAGRVMIP
jgi:Tfp pilus assembly protein FimT